MTNHDIFVTRVIPWLIIAGLSIYVAAFGSEYLLHLAIVTAIYAVLAMSLDIAFGYTGLFSIAHASLFGLGAYTTGLLINEFDMGLPLAMLAGGALSGLGGLTIVLLFSRMDGPYFAIGTFAFGELVRIVLNEWRSLTGGPLGISFPVRAGNIDFLFFEIDFISKRGFFIITLMFATAVAIGLGLLLRSKLGGRMTHVRDDPNLAMSLGVNVLLTKAYSFIISGFVAGVAGGFLGIYLQFVAPQSFSGMESVRIVMMVVIGGAGTLLGPIVGAGLIILLPQMLRIDPTDSLIGTGIILVLVVLFLPKGIVGSAAEWYVQRRKQPDQDEDQSESAAFVADRLERQHGG